MRPYSIVLADDHVIFRRGIRKIIQEVDDFEVVGEAGDGLELLELLKITRPDLIILDISMPNLRGLEATEEIKRQYPQVKVLLLTMHKKKSFVQLGLKAGANGFLLKEDADSELFRAIETIRKGNLYLSPLLANIMRDLALVEPETEKLTRREREVLKLLAEGKKSREIAALLYISLPTVRAHRYSIMRKLDLKSLVDLIKYAAFHEFISTE
ncbi:MAG: response regulator transcription factor [Syntrophales bacterium]|nr:response regulator transcription factor [Syntrophales bacterium]